MKTGSNPPPLYCWQKHNPSLLLGLWSCWQAPLVQAPGVNRKVVHQAVTSPARRKNVSSNTTGPWGSRSAPDPEEPPAPGADQAVDVYPPALPLKWPLFSYGRRVRSHISARQTTRPFVSFCPVSDWSCAEIKTSARKLDR